MIDIDNASPRHLAEMLLEHNKWRRGEGQYSFCENPVTSVPSPFTPTQLGRIIDKAAEVLKKVEKSDERKARRNRSRARSRLMGKSIENVQKYDVERGNRQGAKR